MENNSENQKITLVQRPIIQHRLQELGSGVTERIAMLNIENQVATEDTITALKSLRAELNKEAKEFETQRKALKEALMKPYNEFEDIYKFEIIEKYKEADELLKSKINNFEMRIKAEKREALINYFNELVSFEGIDWLTFDRLDIEVGLSVSEKKYKEQISEKVGKIIEDLDLINTETYAPEILVEYKKTLNVSQSISQIRQRKEQERLEKERIIAQRTDKRIDALRKLAFVKSDIAKAYYLVNDNEVSVSLADIESLENPEWAKRYAELEQAVKSKSQPKEEQRVEPLPQPKVEVLQQPKEQAEQEIYEAKFSVTGTLNELQKLKEFLITNNYQYKNL
ncbi:MAG: DUF1351 domain-containing protein [Prevotellaceae bacterium]|jgi:hypothetical protein|nr:DUF1351 domain-containing protein [Prevotellaceae bacterium]